MLPFKDECKNYIAETDEDSVIISTNEQILFSAWLLMSTKSLWVFPPWLESFCGGTWPLMHSAVMGTAS